MPSSPNALPARIKRVAVFVGIVWAVALSFVALELVALAGFGLVLQTDAGRRRAVPQAVRESQTCTPNSPAGPSASDRADDGKAVSWVLGVTAGIRAQNARWGTYGTGAPAEAPPPWLLIARDRLAQAEAAVGELAAQLQLPPPPAFTEGERADAHHAYMILVESDAAGTARAIATRYSAAACHLFKMGAYWGFASEVRMLLPGQTAPFAPEIEHHAREANLPAGLWAPAIVPPPAGATTAEIAAEIQRVTQGVTEHLK